MPPKIITAKDAAALTGYSKDLISKAVKRGTLKRVFLPGFPAGRTCYLRESDVLTWAEARATVVTTRARRSAQGE